MAMAAATARAQLQVGYYDTLCPAAESSCSRRSARGVRQPRHRRRPPRLHFHDCFVRGGCDGSVLVDSTAGNQAEEKDAPPNSETCGVRGWRQARTRYAGRADETANVSVAEETNGNLPPPTANVDQRSTQIFGSKGLTQAQMVALSQVTWSPTLRVASCACTVDFTETEIWRRSAEAHTVGMKTVQRPSAAGSYSYRDQRRKDPSMDPTYTWPTLSTQCPQSGASQPVAMDPVTPNTFEHQLLPPTSPPTAACSPPTRRCSPRQQHRPGLNSQPTPTNPGTFQTGLPPLTP
ncbi:hypothetical protein ZWY2020_028759 [Hordeum vulgare]|nr:hypothetical protein ZWY2020_028759 [Hordeum vulgare]